MTANYKKTNYFFRRIKMVLVFALLFSTANIFAQQTTVLPGNNNYTQNSSPQGALRYQRGFYLITPKEVNANGLTNGMVINSIGFTLGTAQSDTTRGMFKAYLQNTTDTVSRVDTSWINTTSASASLIIPNGLFPGTYEWQVRAVCTGNSPYSVSGNFSNDNLSSCNPPTNLSTTNIASTTATFNWEVPSSVIVKYYVEYKNADSLNWKLDSTTNTFYNATGLIANKNYQWRVRTSCSSSASGFSTVSFITNAVSSCNLPSALATGSITNTSATVSWTAAAGASFYTVQYRRTGTTNWFTSITFTNSLVISTNLVAGTTYQWQVRTNCPSGTSDYVAGANFTTTGTLVCYPPENLTANALTDSSVVLKWGAVSGATSYEIRYRLKETITWAQAITPASPMTLVHNDSVTIPKTAGSYKIAFTGTGISSFTYTGNGIYVAWEYSQSVATLSTNNITVTTNANTIIKGVNGVDSAKYLLSFIGRSDTNTTGLQTRLINTVMRPETILGSSSLKDSVAVLAVWTLGKNAPRFQDSLYISAQLSNRTNGDKKYGVILNVKEQQSGALRYTKTDSITVRANIDTLITFHLRSSSILENDSVSISIDPQAGENVVNNNSKAFLQSVNPYLLAYADATPAMAQVGFDTLPGLLLTKYTMKGCGKVIAAQVFLTPSANGHPLYAVIRDIAGTITQSYAFTPDSTQINRYHSFYFPTPVSFQNEDFYIGLAQQASVMPYRPVGAQWENSVNRAGAFYKANLDGTGLADSAGFGRLMVRAEIIPSSPQPFIDSAINGKIYLCGPTRTLRAGSIEQRFADSVLSYSSQYPDIAYGANQALGTPDVYPAYGTIAGAWLGAQPDSTQSNKHEYLTLRFPGAAPVNFVDIYETANPGAVDTVWVKNSVTLNYDTVFTRIPDTTLPKVSRKYHVPFALTANPVSEIKIALNSGKITGYNAIDAVAIGQSTVPATYSNYLWTGPGIVGASNTQFITINATGSYKVEVTTATGCPVSSDSVLVVSVPASVTVSPAGPINLCTGDSIWLKSSLSGGNTWSNGSTADSIHVSSTGTYSLTNNVGCGLLNSNSVSVTVIPKPKPRITGNLNICPASTTILDAGTGYASYLWKNSSGTVLSTTQTCTVNNANAGLIRVIVDSVGCKDSAFVITTNVPAPSPVISGNLQFCAGGSTTLDAGLFSTYEWRNGVNAIVGTNQAINILTADNFYVIVTSLFGCTGTSPTVTTSFLPYTAPTITGNSSFCPGSSVILTASAGYSSYVWRKSAGNIVSTNQTLNVSIADTYTVTATAANGCFGTASKTITADPLPTPVITGVFVFCPGGDSTTLHAGPGYVSYVWTNGIGLTIGTDSTVNVYSADNFTVTVTNASGCSGTSLAINTTLLPFTPPTVTGGSAFCPGTSITLTASAGYTSYEWKNSANAIVGTNPALVVTVADTYTVTVTSANACKGSISRTITQNVPPHPVISGPLQFCTGGSTTLNAGPGYTSYVWKNAVGIVVGTNQSYTVTIPGAIRVIVDSLGCSDSTTVTTSTVSGPTPLISGTLQFCTGGSTTLDAGPGYTSYTWLLNGTGIVGTNQTLNVVGAGSYSVIVTNGPGCSGTSAAVSVTVFALPTPTITGNSTFCPGGNVVLTASAGFTSYVWKNSAGVVVGSTATLVVNIADTYTVTVINANNCTGSASKTITQAPVPAPAITGTLSICAGNSTTLNAGVGYASYLWSPGGATTQSITTGTAGIYTVTVTNASGCSGSANVTVTVVNGVPAMPGPISGTVNGLCNTTGNVYSISPVPNTDFYVWTVPFGATIIGAQTGTSITVNYSNLFTTGVISVAAFNTCGQNPTNNPRQLAVTSIPQTPGSITGPVNGLCQQTGIVYSVVPVFSATSYTWSVPSGVVITNGQGTNSITVSFNNTFIADSISVFASSACGSSSLAKLAIQGATLPPGPISGAIIGDCRQESQVYSIAPVNVASSYTWVVPSRVTILEGQGTTSIKVKFDDDFVTGDICVYTNNSCGKSAYRCMTVFESPCPAFIFYPNPTSGIIKALVKYGPYGKYTLMITNFLTQVVYKKEFTWSGTDWIVDLNHLPPGVYDVTIFNETYSKTKKLLKIN